MIGIIVPAHDEEAHIDACITSLAEAARFPSLGGEEVMVLVVLDACSDRTGAIARSLGARTVAVEAQNVGVARRLGAEIALRAGARWLAFTDADSTVAPDWLAAQLALQSDVVCGTVAVDDWGAYGERMRRHYEATYFDRDGHKHVHGANLGVSAQAYLNAGGFSPLACSEDVALVAALQASGASIAWSAAPRVVTSARASFKAQGGFGATLEQIESEQSWAGMPELMHAQADECSASPSLALWAANKLMGAAGNQPPFADSNQLRAA